jgi:hypothetical protein
MHIVEKPEHRPGPTLSGVWIRVSIGVVAVVALGALILLQPRQPNGAASGVAETPAAASLIPGATVTRDEAIAIARQFVQPDRTVVQTSLGPYSTAPVPSRFDRTGAAADQVVWVVEFEGTFDICNPFGACLSPRPGFSYVVIDANTGSWITTFGTSPP